MRVARFSRAEFLASYWNYRPGEHVSLIGPTQQAGKTRMLFDLLGATDWSWCSVPPTVLVAKPRDSTVAAGTGRLGWEVTSRWPPRKKVFSAQPPGYAMWPKHLKDATVEQNNAHLRTAFEPAIQDHFWKGNSLIVADEVYYLSSVLGMDDLLIRHWTQGMGMGAGLWSATQRPSGTSGKPIPGFMYNSATHTFLARDPDKRNRQRFAEIGGVDPELIEYTTMNLAPFQFLYIHRAGPYMAIVEAA
jgi:hypothetical protein